MIHSGTIENDSIFSIKTVSKPTPTNDNMTDKRAIKAAYFFIYENLFCWCELGSLEINLLLNHSIKARKSTKGEKIKILLSK